jgi:hypothetical protein
MRMFLTPDSKAGFALKGNDIVSVFRHPDEPIRNAAASMIEMAIQQGGRRLDAFDTILPSIYSRHGFKATSRSPFVDEFAPPGWDHARFAKFNEGRPDVVYMTLDPSHGRVYSRRDGKVVDFEEARELQELETANVLRRLRDRPAMHGGVRFIPVDYDPFNE